MESCDSSPKASASASGSSVAETLTRSLAILEPAVVMLPGGSSVLSDYFPPSKRGRAYGTPSGHGWKLGNDGGAGTPMEPSVLGEFFARHPSASGGSRAGGYYQIICDECGALVPVAAPDAAARRIDIRCADCGWEEHLVEAPAAG